MAVDIKVRGDLGRLPSVDPKALQRALRKAGSTAQRDMRSEASKRVRTRKAIKPRYIREALSLSREMANNIHSMKWALEISGARVPIAAYPHRQTKKGVTIEVNRGKRTLVKRSFMATMKSGHRGVFKRKGAARLPIQELRGSRPLDALSHEGELQAVAERGARSFVETFHRVLPLELRK